MPRAEFRRLRAHDLDLGPDWQFRPGQLHGGETWHNGAVARDRARYAALQGALELRRAVCLDAHDRLDSGANGRREETRRAVQADDAGEDRAARGLSRLRPRRRRYRPGVRGAQQRSLSVQPAATDPLAAPLRRLDAAKARRAAQGGIRSVADPV